MEAPRFSGSIPALVTPFRGGAVDEAALAALIDWQIGEGSSALVPCGTTGEAATLSIAEHDHVVRLTVAAAAGRVPVIAGCGSNDTQAALDHMLAAKEAGASAALVVCPYYNKPSQAGLAAHFELLAERGGLPVILYNIPGRSVVDMATATMAALARHPAIIGVKESTGDLGRISAIRHHCGHDFQILSGNDDMTLGILAQGGVGAISVTANVAPRLCADLAAAAARGDYVHALAVNDRLWPLHSALFSDASPAPVKHALARLGRMAADVRLPLVAASAASRAAVEAAMMHAGLTGGGGA
ncbi:4-hydroxy-tetrahydrodipicolinate synthase [Sandaracinobacteroides saxicola]|uniref:4-hydroxy-tetrahydrodipicolinate synthase n=2 Tax=Sandaracinobacteroides saxicola TaxID=2759707 RepID=A0A7G5IMF0_9SPHN|nr:4-hydroxy-tetrahydrodipicolinate synthase [Sandaracinobacteroides saxicola]